MKPLQWWWQNIYQRGRYLTGKSVQYLFTAEQKGIRFSEEKGLMSIKICARFLFKNIKKFGR